MAKFINKSDCVWDNGYVVNGDEIVNIPFAVAMQARALDIMLQQYRHLKKQPTYVPAPSLDDFKAQHIYDGNRPYLEMPDTPVTDKRVAESMAFLDECHREATVKEVNAAIDKFGLLVDWLDSDKILVDDTATCSNRFDTPALGDMLELSSEDVVSILLTIAESPVELDPHAPAWEF